VTFGIQYCSRKERSQIDWSGWWLWLWLSRLSLCFTVSCALFESEAACFWLGVPGCPGSVCDVVMTPWGCNVHVSGHGPLLGHDTCGLVGEWVTKIAVLRRDRFEMW